VQKGLALGLYSVVNQRILVLKLLLNVLKVCILKYEFMFNIWMQYWDFGLQPKYKTRLVPIQGSESIYVCVCVCVCVCVNVYHRLKTIIVFQGGFAISALQTLPKTKYSIISAY